jgi:uncharacterized cupin superfamily protein
MSRHKSVIHLSEVSREAIKAPEGSAFSGVRQRVGLAIGANKLGYSVYAVPPGKTAFPFHAHYTNEEMIYILEGEGIARIGKDEIQVSAETFIAFPPGTESSHQLINTSKSDLRYLCVSTMQYPDLTEYPDANKVGALATSANEAGFRAFYRKDSNVDYYEGESSSEVERIVNRDDK